MPSSDSTGPIAALESGASEVKGIWFVTLRRYLEDELGPDVLEDVVEAMPETLRGAMKSPLTSSWYPEQALAAALSAVDARAAYSDERKLTRIIEACTEQGISRFFRVFLRLTTPAFVVRQLPTLWRQMRRGRGRVRVEIAEASATVEYSDFPHFDDRRYRVLAEGTLRGLMRVATRQAARVEVKTHEKDRLTVLIGWQP